MSVHWNKVILFGDSLTQRGFDVKDGNWAAIVADRLQRISDVMVRGFSGYNSRWLRMIVPKVFAKETNFSDVSCLTILIGANDSSDVDSVTKQHVPIDEYQNNLVLIIDYLEGIGISKDKMILMSPPNCFTHTFVEYCKQNGRPVPKKDNETVGQYADACRRAALRSGVEFIDLFENFSKHQNSEQLFCDGLHFSSKGSQFLFDLVFPSIEKRVKQYNGCSELKMNFPIFTDIDTESPEKSLL